MSDTSCSFFERFTDFTPNPSASLDAEFARLARTRGWKPGSKKWRKNRQRCFQMEFDSAFGTDATRLQNWQNLCEELDLNIPGTITQCKKELHMVHVNLVDLMNSRRTGRPVRKFPSAHQLQKYTLQKRDRIFPKKDAKEDGFLKELLRKIF